MTSASELRQLGTEELQVHLAESKAEIFNLRFQYATGQFDRTHRFKELKREIARTLTILGERAVDEAEALGAEPEAGAPGEIAARQSLRSRWRSRRAARSAGLAAAEAESAEHAGENVEISVMPEEHDHEGHDHEGHDHARDHDHGDDELTAEALAAGVEDAGDEDGADYEEETIGAEAVDPEGSDTESEAAAPDSGEEEDA